MDTNTVLVIFGAAVLVLVTVAATRWAGAQQPGSIANSVEHEMAKVVGDTLTKLADTSHEDAVIAAAVARKGLKMKLLVEIQSAITAKLPAVR